MSYWLGSTGGARTKTEYRANMTTVHPYTVMKVPNPGRLALASACAGCKNAKAKTAVVEATNALRVTCKVVAGVGLRYGSAEKQITWRTLANEHQKKGAPKTQ